MSLYNCKEIDGGYRISKFSNDLDVEASYLTNGSECDCPAGHRPVCRHRIMLPRFIAKNAIAGQWFHNYEHQQWIRAASDDEPDTLGDLASAASQVEDTADIERERATEAFHGLHVGNSPGRDALGLASGINLLDLASTTPQQLHETIGEALGESTSDNSDFATAMRATAPKPLRRI